MNGFDVIISIVWRCKFSITKITLSSPLVPITSTIKKFTFEPPNILVDGFNMLISRSFACECLITMITLLSFYTGPNRTDRTGLGVIYCMCFKTKFILCFICTSKIFTLEQFVSFMQISHVDVFLAGPTKCLFT